MRRIIIPLLFLVLFIDNAIGQDSLSFQLMTIEKKVFQTTSDTVINELLLEKFDLLLHNGNDNFEDALKTAKRIKSELIELKPERARFFWNASLVAYLEKDIYYGLHFIDAYERLELDSSIQFLSLKFFINSNINEEVSKSIVDDLILKDSIFQGFHCYQNAQEYKVRATKLKIVMSYIIPGSGMIINGNIVKGLISMGLNTTTVLAISYLWKRNLYLNTLAWGSNLIMKFYIGNTNLTKKLLNERELTKQKRLANSCEPLIDKCLIKYPLEFRFVN